jgi:hypothetical protein
MHNNLTEKWYYRLAWTLAITIMSFLVMAGWVYIYDNEIPKLIVGCRGEVSLYCEFIRSIIPILNGILMIGFLFILFKTYHYLIYKK